MSLPVIRPIDRWFIDEVLPHEAGYLKLARRFSQSADESADLVQEAYARLFATDGWPAITNPPAYVARAIRHIAIERLRRAKVVDFRQLVDADYDELVDDAPDPLQILAGKDAMRRFADALARLPERCRDVFVRRRVHGQLPREISEELGVSLSTLEKRLARAFFLLARDGIGDGPSTTADDLPASSDAAHGG